MTRSIILPALAGFAATATILFAAPAVQAQSTDYRCTGLMQQATAAATSTTDAAKAARAQRFIRTGVALCNASAEGEGARQFRSALRVLGVSEVRNADASQMAATTTATGGN